MQQTIAIENRVHLSLPAQPIRIGVPWPRGAVQPETLLGARNENGTPIPVAARLLNSWQEGPVQCVAWCACEWQFAWIKSMYFIKLAFEQGVIQDEDVLVS